MTWRLRTRILDLSQRGVIMGILNVTPDSFSDGGDFTEVEQAVQHGKEMIAQGAEIIDIGGESTRPGAEPVELEEELRRVLPVIERLALLRVPLSIDTMKPEVAKAALRCGAEIVNDVTGLRLAAMRAVVREEGAGAVIMHMKGTPADMQRAPEYADVTGEIREFFRQSEETCLQSGVDPASLVYDPGIGFGKTAEHNWTLLNELERLALPSRPLVLGVSRKSFLGKVTGSREMRDRSWPTVALTSYARARGVRVIRAHEVTPNLEALRMMEAITET